MGMLKEFKEFAMKGNVVDMAVGIIIGGAFGKIVSSFVNDVLMPPIGKLIGGVNFSELKYPLGGLPELKDEAGKITQEATEVFLNYGAFAQSILDFLIIAGAVFMGIKAMNKASSLTGSQEEEAAAEPEKTPEDIELLREIRDALKKS